MQSHPKYVSVVQLARHAGLPARWIRREVLEGRLPALRVGRRTLLPLADTLEALLTAS